jgi:hypothetical protein
MAYGVYSITREKIMMSVETKQILDIDFVTDQVMGEVGEKPGFSDFLTRYYLHWQLLHGRASIREFAKWLNINHSLVVQWMNERGSPGPQNISMLVRKMGPIVLEYFPDYPAPPESAIKLEYYHEQLQDHDKKELDHDFDKWLETWLLDHGFQRVK